MHAKTFFKKKIKKRKKEKKKKVLFVFVLGLVDSALEPNL